MKKTQAAQVYFPVSLYYEIKLIAEKEQKPLAAWIRDVVKKEVKTHHKGRAKLSDMPTFDWKTGPADLSERIDEFLYDSP
ncbi:MAG: hypothetical protein AAB802_01505 [Patescibacteria group bacterium]